MVRPVAVAVVPVLVVPVLAGVAAPPAAAAAAVAGVASGGLLPVHAVVPHPVGRARAVSWRLPAPAWPAAGRATVTVPATAGAAGAGGNARLAGPSAGSARAGGLPVEVGPADSPAGAGGGAAGPSSGASSAAAGPGGAGPGGGVVLGVTMAPHAVAVALGVAGVVLSLGRTDGAGSPARVHVSVDYRSFAFTDGGDFGSRLRLVSLPGCALSTPRVAACRAQTPVGSFNDANSFRLGADVSVPAGGGGGLVLAAVTGTSGGGGDFGQAPLSGAGSWSAGGNNGAFTYSYPISVPPVPGALVPPVTLGYDSQAVDGLTSSTGNQASWVGDGWNYSPGFIERDYQQCSKVAGIAAADKTGDLCQSPADVTTISLNGRSSTLVKDDATGAWHAEADGGDAIQHLTGTSNGTHSGDYWVVTTPDGTSYYFGMTLPGYSSSAGDTPANAAWTVPVWAPASGEECYNATFSASHCMLAYSWRLDYVVDRHGDAMAYLYKTEKNSYASRNLVCPSCTLSNTTADQSYTQAGVPFQAWYGLRDSANIYGSSGSPAGSAEVEFNSKEDRTDVPTGTGQDLACSLNQTCDVASPSFWGKFRLDSIDTKASDGGTLVNADSWQLAQSYPATGDSTSPSLWLDSVTRTGLDTTACGTSGCPAAAPLTVSFTHKMMANRVNTADGYPPVTRGRIAQVINETGGTTSVTYSPPLCPATPPVQDVNHSLCYPDWWSPPGGSGSFKDWFNKYVVTAVTQADHTASQPPVTTTYCYGGGSGGCLSGGAWRYDYDGLIRSDQRTWDQWQGFGAVTVTTGTSPDPVTQVTSSFFQGMNGDHMADGTTLSRSLTSSQLTGQVSEPDSQQWTGMPFETITYDGAGGPAVSASVTVPWSSPSPTADQSQSALSLPDLKAYLTGAAKTQSFTGLAAGGPRESDVIYGHDSIGRVTSEADVPDTADASLDICTTASYDVASSAVTSLPAEVLVTPSPPASCPAVLPSGAAGLISDTRYYYDQSATLGAAPSRGNVTKVTQVTSYGGTTPVYTTQYTASSVDEYGRPLTFAGPGQVSQSAAYTPATGAEPTSATATDPAGLKTTTSYDPLRELATAETSPAGWVTATTYDQMGRVTSVTPPQTLGVPQVKYSYNIRATGASVVTTQVLDPAGTGYLPTQQIYDSLGRPVETQSQTPDGNRDVTDTTYNTDGQTALTSQPYPAAGVPSGSLVQAASDTVPEQAAYTYDGAGRVTAAATYSLGVKQYETDTAYGGNYTTVSYAGGAVPAAGTAQTSYVNGAGQVTGIYQYHGPAAPAVPPAPGTGSNPGGADTPTATYWDHTGYAYTAAGQLASITDTAGNTWSFGYDLAGDQVTQTTPDTGTSTAVYDASGNLLQATNATGQVASYTYDADNRLTGEYAAPVTGQAAANKVAVFTWDTLAAGQLTSAASYTSGSEGPAYTEAVTGYAAGLAKGTQVTIPSGPLAGTYATDYSYAADGQLAKYTDSVAGPLPAETVTTGLDAAGEPDSVAGAAGVNETLAYSELGQPHQYQFGPAGAPAEITSSYGNLGQLTEQQATLTQPVTPPTSPPTTQQVTADDQHYSYDAAGDILTAADTPSGGPAQVQCYRYDWAGRLTTAWSQGSAGCTAGPSQTAEATAAVPYWNAYAYDTTPAGQPGPAQGNLAEVTAAPPTGTAAVTGYAYNTPGAGQPHAVQSVTSGSGTTSYAYNTAGQLTTITPPAQPAGGQGQGPETLTWGGPGRDPGQLTAATSDGNTTSYVYDAAGNLLLETQPSGAATLTLPDAQLTYTPAAAGASAVTTGTRYYSLGGDTAAVLTATTTSSGTTSSVSYLAGDQQGTTTLAISYATTSTGITTYSTTRRYYDPYGNPLAPAPVSWPGGPTARGYVGGTPDPATGNTILGARQYNPANGAFTSPDPILNPGNPADLNPYAYAYDNPATNADPTGLNVPCDVSSTEGYGVQVWSCYNQDRSANEYRGPVFDWPTGTAADGFFGFLNGFYQGSGIGIVVHAFGGPANLPWGNPNTKQYQGWYMVGLAGGVLATDGIAKLAGAGLRAVIGMIDEALGGAISYALGRAGQIADGLKTRAGAALAGAASAAGKAGDAISGARGAIRDAAGKAGGVVDKPLATIRGSIKNAFSRASGPAVKKFGSALLKNFGLLTLSSADSAACDARFTGPNGCNGSVTITTYGLAANKMFAEDIPGRPELFAAVMAGITYFSGPYFCRDVFTPLIGAC